MMREGFHIRQAISSDIKALAGMDHGYSTDHVWQLALQRGSDEIKASLREVRLPRPMQVSYPRNPERLLDEWTDKAVLLMAAIGEDPAGYLSLLFGPADESGWITDVVVDLRYRRQGIGQKLVGAAKEWARQRQIVKLFIEMQSKNYPGIRLAQKTGFTFAGFSDMYYPDQDIVLLFALEL
ncbi:MAG: GNAT family N-acetyltransferase [Anaerolineales bacterium]|nr:GNAT family N-acetyltransferase [Anaerolineales bacterium]